MIGRNPDGSWKKFEDLTEGEVSEICNGCGGKGGIVVPPHAIFFDTDCDHHDFGYFKGGDEGDRLMCDAQLKAAMVRDCQAILKKAEAGIKNWIKARLKYARYRPWCEAYYWAVRAIGWKYFNYAKAEVI